jgi:hypothetical protein
MDRAMAELKDFAITAVKRWELESEQLTAMWTKANELEIRDATEGLLTDYLSEAQFLSTADGHWVKGHRWEVNSDFNWIWEGWIAEGLFHVVTALPKVGKSTLMLNLFAELSKRTQSFLNFPISIGKKYELFLIGPDMSRFNWDKAGRESGLLIDHAVTGSEWQPIVQEVWAEEDRVGLTSEFIKTLVAKAEESIARGAHPIFFFDSYKKLLFFAGDDSDPGSAKFAKRLNMLREAMTGVSTTTGVTPTTIVLNHASLSSSKRSASLAAGGDQTFMGIPDQCIALNWVTGVDSAVRKDKRVVLTAEGRTTMVMPAELIEQHTAGQWMTHGEAGDAEVLAKALDERDRLGTTDHAAVYDIINGRTHAGVPTTQRQISEIRETQTGGKTTWSQPKINRSLQYLKRRELIVEDGSEMAPGDLGGRPSVCWVTFEKEVLTPPQPLNRDSRGLNANDQPSDSSVESVKPLKSHESMSGVSAYGDNPPSERQMVEDANGKNSMVVVELVPGSGDVKVQEFGNASSPIKQRRWLVDVFPCGTYAKNNPVVFDDNEVL